MTLEKEVLAIGVVVILYLIAIEIRLRRISEQISAIWEKFYDRFMDREGGFPRALGGINGTLEVIRQEVEKTAKKG